MKCSLLYPVTEHYTDRSTTKSFAFSFYCDKCGKEWRSAPKAFQTGVKQSHGDQRVIRMLWTDQHKAAYEKANLEAINTFYYCSECRRRICMECYTQSETDIAEVCIDCLQAATAKQPIRD